MSVELPLPPHYDPEKVGWLWPVPYAERAAEAREWARRHGLQPAAADRVRICLLGIDIQNTFCLPGGELFVAGRSGDAAVQDNRRLAAFIYRNLGAISEIAFTLDTHYAHAIFHAGFWQGPDGEPPAPYTQISHADVVAGRWRVSEGVARALGHDPEYLQAHARHYTAELERQGKYRLTIWPYHAMLGGVGHALVPAIEEAAFFHSVARGAQVRFEVKGANPLTENYSPFRPEVLTGPGGAAIATKNPAFLRRLLGFDALIIAGQAKSHCVAWAVADLLDEITAQDPALAKKVYLLADCTSPVVVPGLDCTEQAEAAFARFAAAGMHIVRSTEPLVAWPGLAPAPRG